ncbi:uncharacterized protein L201_000702 [Kwoniella dendrophila CBS 6074]|uniref:AAA+ ATPase domain-containing protein n=1 Tax=Kwoniella dendrophila CBS 6074 TaxID=1295534 RepID=A0AAX4JMT4_9TREE
MPILEAPQPPRPSSNNENRFNGFTTSNSMHSIASTSTDANGLNGGTNQYDDDEDDYQNGTDNMHIDDDQDGQSELSEDEEDKPVVHVEIRLSSILANNRQIRQKKDHVRYLVAEYIQGMIGGVELGKDLKGWQTDSEDLLALVDRIWVEEGAQGITAVDIREVIFEYHIYQPSKHEFVEDFTNELDDDDESPVTAATIRTLPSQELDGLWNTLIYPNNLKSRLLNYCYSTTFFSESNVDFNVIAWNRVMLLHGPPGTGKTSLCRAIAQKIAIRMNTTYPSAKLIEINSHSLFSKWFSESGKLVQKLFDTITKEVDDEDQFVVVMIDEVESLTAARAAAMSGTEPSDSLRVVNALLTQLDRLRTRKNVLVMTTSNLVDAIDEAFMSRVDMLELVPLPPPEAVYSILKGCIDEMMSKRMIKSRDLSHVDRAMDFKGTWEIQEDRTKRYSGGLAALAVRCHELEISGRTLRKLPVLAHTTKLSNTSGGGGNQNRRRPLSEWIKAMLEIVNSTSTKRKHQESHLQNGVDTDSQAKRQHRRNASIASIEKGEFGTSTATKGGKDIR